MASRSICFSFDGVNFFIVYFFLLSHCRKRVQARTIKRIIKHPATLLTKQFKDKILTESGGSVNKAAPLNTSQKKNVYHDAMWQFLRGKHTSHISRRDPPQRCAKNSKTVYSVQPQHKNIHRKNAIDRENVKIKKFETLCAYLLRNSKALSTSRKRAQVKKSLWKRPSVKA